MMLPKPTPPSHPNPSTATLAGAQYKELMDYLGRDKAMAQAQLLLLSEERSALRAARDNANKQVGGSLSSASLSH